MIFIKTFLIIMVILVGIVVSSIFIISGRISKEEREREWRE